MAAYFCGGFTDCVDGAIARRFGLQTNLGAKLDSIADLVFASSIFIMLIKSNIITPLLWYGIGIVFIIKIFSYAIGYIKFHSWSALHTYLNKASGFVLFIFPLLFITIGLNLSVLMVFIITLTAAAEECVIIIFGKKLDRNCKGFFYLNK